MWAIGQRVRVARIDSLVAHSPNLTRYLGRVGTVTRADTGTRRGDWYWVVFTPGHRPDGQWFFPGELEPAVAPPADAGENE